MKKFRYALWEALLVSVLLMAGCAKTDAPPAEGGKATPAPAATAAPTPTPTPVPTPIPYAAAASGHTPEYRFAADYEQVKAALSAEPEALPDDPWTLRFASAGITAPAAPRVARLREPDEEGDILTSDGSVLYLLDQKDLLVLSPEGGDSAVLARLKVGIDWTGGESDNGTNVSGYEKTPLAVFSLNGIVAVVSDWYGYSGSAQALTYTEYTSVDLFRVSDPKAPVFLASVGQDGIYKNARLTGDGILTLLTDYIPADPEMAPIEELVPGRYSGASRTPLMAEKILLTRAAGERAAGYAVLGCYDLAASGENDVIAVPGLAMEDAALLKNGPWMICRGWSESPSRDYMEDGAEIHEQAVTACTDVFRMQLQNGSLSAEAVTTFNGWLPDASALDVQDEQLLYASSLCQGLYTLDAQGDPIWRETVTGTRIAGWAPGMGDVFSAELPIEEESVSWVGLLKTGAACTTGDGESFYLGTDSAGMEYLAEPLDGDTILPWGEDGYMAFYGSSSGRLTLSVRDSRLRELAVRSFGSDYSNTLQSRKSYFSDASANLLGFSADDSYCLYGFAEGDGLFFRESVFLTDWGWNARAIRLGDRLVVADTAELYVYDAATLDRLSACDLSPEREE